MLVIQEIARWVVGCECKWDNETNDKANDCVKNLSGIIGKIIDHVKNLGD